MSLLISRPLREKLNAIADEITDIDEETYALFCHDFPPLNLGMIDEKAKVLNIEVAGENYEIRQSLGLLTSTNTEGTTGAAVWKITPLVVNWLADQTNVLWSNGILHPQAIVVELGSGISGLLGYALASRIAKCILTDQKSIVRLLEANVTSNVVTARPPIKSKKSTSRIKGRKTTEIHVRELNWEHYDADAMIDVLQPDDRIDLIVLCDCIYNDFLIKPLIRSCEDLCRKHGQRDTVLLVAHQLRSDEVVSQFLDILSKSFDIWRLADAFNHLDLRDGSGFAIHLACLKSS